ncbi:MAG: peptide-methionine (S)-S-oxide reductase, partial [Campylobacteraceae bacterium]|nr:peptide-methionine (S)-S-oxide reductase [Campylobacteraceae bacterium]
MKLILIFLLTTTMWAKEATMSNKELVLGGGCFWCLEAVFEEIPGVKNVVSGYMGGDESSANYVAVSTGQTEHAEVVRISFDPNITNMEKLLNVFWMIHDP